LQQQIVKSDLQNKDSISVKEQYMDKTMLEYRKEIR